MNKTKILANLALLFTAAVWGIAFVFQKYAVEELSSSFIIAARFTIAGILMALATIKKWKLIDKGYLIGGLLSGVAIAIGSWLQTFAMTYGTTPGKSAFLTAAYCVLVPFIYWGITKERPRINHVVSGVICLLGIGLISLDGNLRITIGDGITLLCSVAFACNIISISIFSKNRDVVLLTMLQICVAAVCGWIALIFEGGFTLSMSPLAFGSVLFLAFFSTGLCLILQTVGLKHTDATVGTILLSSESVFGVVFSVLLYHEVVTGRIGIGFAIVFAAVILSQLEYKKKSAVKAVESAE